MSWGSNPDGAVREAGPAKDAAALDAAGACRLPRVSIPPPVSYPAGPTMARGRRRTWCGQRVQEHIATRSRHVHGEHRAVPLAFGPKSRVVTQRHQILVGGPGDVSSLIFPHRVEFGPHAVVRRGLLGLGVPLVPDMVWQVVFLHRALFDDPDLLNRFVLRVPQGVHAHAGDVVVPRVVVLTLVRPPRTKRAPRCGSAFIERAALPFGDHVRVRVVRRPAAEHVPHDEVHHRMGSGAEAQSVAEQSVAEHTEIGGDETDNQPTSHVRVLPWTRGEQRGDGEARNATASFPNRTAGNTRADTETSRRIGGQIVAGAVQLGHRASAAGGHRAVQLVPQQRVRKHSQRRENCCSQVVR